MPDRGPARASQGLLLRMVAVAGAESDLTVRRRIAAATAVTTAIVIIDAAYAGGHDADRFSHTDIYERRDGRWQAVRSEATRIRAPRVGDPT